MSQPKLVTVFGGSGFIGRYIVRRLMKKGYRVRVAVRRPDLAQHLQPMGTVGQVHAVQANVRYPDSVKAAVSGADFVINATGILYPSGKQTFKAVVDEGAQIIAQAATEAGLDRIVHISAIGADETSDSHYAQSKAAAEKHVLGALPDSVILRPSVVFGPEDEFFNRFAAMTRFSPVLPLVSGDTLFQPVYVDDVAEAVVYAMEGQAQAGDVYELGGPEKSSFEALMKTMLDTVARKRLIISLPASIGAYLAMVLQFAPGALKLTPDQVRLLAKDNVVTEAAESDKRTLEGLGVSETPMATVLPKYLVQYRPEGQFTRLDDDQTA